MKGRSRWILVLSGAVLLAGAAAVQLLRNGRGEAGVTTASASEELRKEFQTSDQSEGIRYSGRDAKQRIAAMVTVRLDEFGAVDSALIDLALQRTDLLFDPDFDRWADYSQGRERVRGTGWTPPVGELRERWESQAASFADPVVRTEDIWVRAIDPTRPFPESQPGTVWVGPDFAVSAPVPGVAEFGPEAEGIEVLYPVTIRDGDGRSLDATVSIVLVRKSPGADWEEMTTYVYMGAEGFDRQLSMPPI